MSKKQSNPPPVECVCRPAPSITPPPPLTARRSWVEHRLEILEDKITKIEKTLDENGIYHD